METKNSTTPTLKIRDLCTGSSYFIMSHKMIDTKFGPTHILNVSADVSTNQGFQNFEMWSTPAINKFINSNNLNPRDKICFTVSQSDKYGFYATNISLFTN